MGRSATVLLSLIALLSASARASAPVNPAQEMLNYFASTCASQGAWTRAAIGKASSLVSTLQAIKDSPECNDFIGSAGRLRTLDAQVQSIAEMNAPTAQLLRDRSIEQTILLKLGTTTDPTAKADLLLRLTSVQLEITALETDAAHTAENADRETRILSGIARDTDDFLAGASNNVACLLGNAGLLSDVAQLSGGIVSTLAAANPGLSLGVAGGTQMLSSVIRAARNRRITRDIRKMNRANDVAAMSCVLESLSADYCDASDAVRVIDWKTEHSDPVENPPARSLRAAVGLMDHEVPSLLEWLESVRTSALVSTVADGERVKDFFARDALLQGTLPVARGLFNQRAPILASIPIGDSNQKWNALRDTLFTLMDNIGGSRDAYGNAPSVRNPLFNVYPKDVGLYYLVGIPEDDIPIQSGSGSKMEFNMLQLSTWPKTVPKPVFDDTLLPTVLNRLVVWYREAQRLLGSERAKIVNPDALNTLTLCTARNVGAQKIPACTALSELRKFLDYRLSEGKLSVAFRRLHVDTRDRLLKIEAAMRKLDDSRDPTEEDLSAILGEVYLQGQLDYGTFYLKGRFDSLLRMAFTDLFDQADPRDVDMAAESLASERFMDALERVKPGKDLKHIRSDIETSLTLNQTTLDEFVGSFGAQISDVLGYLRDKESENLPDPASTGADKSRSFRSDRAKICLNLLNATRWPDKVDPSLCTGLRYQPLPPRGPVSETITPELIGARPEKRMCRYHEVLRETDIFATDRKRR